MRDRIPARGQKNTLLGQKASAGSVKSCNLTEHTVDGANEDVVLFGDFGDEHIRRVRSISHLEINKKRTDVNHQRQQIH